jgi:hypothetical protein
MKDDNVTLRLRHITNVLKNKDKDKEFYDNIYLNKMEVQSYYNDLEKEKNKIYKKMIKDGRWNEYMGITGDFISHTYS